MIKRGFPPDWGITGKSVLFLRKLNARNEKQLTFNPYGLPLSKIITKRGTLSMANCESLSKCPFFHDKMAKKTVLAYVYKQRFCKGDNSQCARYAVLKYLGKGNIPADLYPNEMTKARAIILAGSKDIDTTSIMCECFDTCDLFSCEIAKLPTTSKSFQNKFCSMDNNACARYIVYKQLGEKHVPTDLFPNERGRAMKLIEAV